MPHMGRQLELARCGLKLGVDPGEVGRQGGLDSQVHRHLLQLLLPELG